MAEEKARSIKEAQARAEAEVAGKKYVPPPPSKDKKRPERKVGEDGFEVARGNSKPVNSKPAAARKESTTRTGFSFANAAGSGFANEATEVEDIEEISNGVENVKV